MDRNRRNDFISELLTNLGVSSSPTALQELCNRTRLIAHPAARGYSISISSMADQRRRNQRIEVDLSTELSRIEPEGPPAKMQLTDLSGGGVRFRTAAELGFGDGIEFDIPLDILIRVKARVT